MRRERSMVGMRAFGTVLGLLLSAIVAGCAGKADGDGDGGGGAKVSDVGVQQSVDKVDLLFMIDNSISMGDKQRLLADAVPVLVNRFVDPVCIDGNGNPTGFTTSTGCLAGSPEFARVQNLHVGVITSSLGSHGGDVCVPDPMDMPPRTLNDAAELIASVRTGIYSYQNQGFLVWDPRVGADRPAPDPHPGISNHEQIVDAFVTDFTQQITAAGERGCDYEASLESWYRFLVDPEPIDQVTTDAAGQFSVRGPINQVVLEQRRAFLRPDSLLVIVMLTDENDCSIRDENGEQGWLVGRNVPMPRGSDACSHPEDPAQYRCCIPCVLLDSPGFTAPAGCSYRGDVACSAPTRSLDSIEDSTALRCYRQMRRFGLDLLYPWQRYVDGLTAPRIALREPDSNGQTEVPNPIFTPGADGTPARQPRQVFLVGIVGVPWQDLADQASLSGRALKYLATSEMEFPQDAAGAPFGPNRWDVILGDPDTGTGPLDPFMIESIDPRSGDNPVPGVNAAIAPPTATGQANPINGHEQNIVNRDDLQYACTFDLVPDAPCSPANQDGCECNASEQVYGRPLCQYSGAGTDGTQIYAKAYPGVRQLQVLKAFGENAVVASICPKNVTANGPPASDPDYGYNPAVGAMMSRMREALGPSCLPRPLATSDDGKLACKIVEVRAPTADCSCDLLGRERPSRSVTEAVHDELSQRGFCSGSCDSYCLCEIQELAGAQLDSCRNSPSDPGSIHGFCYVAPDEGLGTDELIARCPAAQRQTIRFMGDDLPFRQSAVYFVCP